MDVLLHVGGEQFVMDISEAMTICETLNACNQLGKEWNGMRSANVSMFVKPDIKAELGFQPTNGQVVKHLIAFYNGEAE